MSSFCFLIVSFVIHPRIKRDTPKDPHVSKIDDNTDCSLGDIDNSDDEVKLPNDILEALVKQDGGSKPNIEELEVVNLEKEGEKLKEVKIGAHFSTNQKDKLIALLKEFREIFAWSYQDMPSLDTDIVVYQIPLKPECKPIRQVLRWMKPEIILKIKEEVEKQLRAGFLSTVTYSDQVANIVPMPKKDGKVKMCLDYRDLNRASPKDNFPYLTLIHWSIIQQRMRCFRLWMASRAIIRLRWSTKISPKQLLSRIGEHLYTM